MKEPYFVGICGGSASGKTFMLKQILNQLHPEKVTLISQDNYYLPIEEQKRDAEGLINFDHPDAVDLDRLERHVKKLIHGESVQLKEYTFNNPKITPKTVTYQPTPIVILEGLFIYYRESLSKLIDLKIFVEAEEHIKLVRRLRRDISERGYSLESILRDYEKFVAPMYKRYVEPTKYICDLIVPNNKRLYKAIQVITHHLQNELDESEGN